MASRAMSANRRTLKRNLIFDVLLTLCAFPVVFDWLCGRCGYMLTPTGETTLQFEILAGYCGIMIWSVLYNRVDRRRALLGMGAVIAITGASLNWVGERRRNGEVELASHPVANGSEIGEVAEASGPPARCLDDAVDRLQSPPM